MLCDVIDFRLGFDVLNFEKSCLCLLNILYGKFNFLILFNIESSG